jgi:hypothetical protein
MPAYLEKLVLKRPALDRRVRRVIDRFVTKMNANGDPWERRFASKFGIVLAAAILLAEFGLVPWTKKRAQKAIAAIYKRARASSVSIDEAADALLVKVRAHVMEKKRFPEVDKGQQLAADQVSAAWGATVDVPGVGRVVAIPYAQAQAMVEPSATTRSVLRELVQRKIILPSKKGKLTRQVMIKGLTGQKRPRFLCFRYKKIIKHR